MCLYYRTICSNKVKGENNKEVYWRISNIFQTTELDLFYSGNKTHQNQVGMQNTY